MVYLRICIGQRSCVVWEEKLLRYLSVSKTHYTHSDTSLFSIYKEVCHSRAQELLFPKFTAYMRLKYGTINTVSIFIFSSEMVLSVSIKLNFYEREKDSDTHFFLA